VRQRTKAALTLAAMVTTAAGLAVAAAGPAAAKPYPPPSIHLVCSAAANDGTLAGSVCVLPPGVTTAPNSYSATIAVGKAGSAGATVSFALTAGSLPPGLTMAAQSAGSGAAISGNPTKAGTFNFTVRATDGGLTSTMAYQITITVKGSPDQLLCNTATGSFLISGSCVLPDAVVGQSYQGHLVTSHNAGGTLSLAAGTLPPGLSLPATFGASGAIVDGTPAQPGEEPTYSFTVQGTGDQGQPLYQAYQITVDPNQPLTIVLPSSGSTFYPGTVGQSLALDFFLSGGAGPYTWTVVGGQLPPGMTLQNSSAGPRDANNQIGGTPTTAGTFKFTMRLTDYAGQQVTQQFTLPIQP
jgi:large repetitive protein